MYKPTVVIEESWGRQAVWALRGRLLTHSTVVPLLLCIKEWRGCEMAKRSIGALDGP